jgi:hypothetical protein
MPIRVGTALHHRRDDMLQIMNFEVVFQSLFLPLGFLGLCLGLSLLCARGLG